MTVVELVQAKLPPDMEDSPAIETAAAEAEQKVHTYCNLPDEEPLPKALAYTVANMALDLIQLRQSAADGETAGPIKSVSMGDVSYSFDTASDRAALDQLLLNYEGDLKRYRRIRR